MSSSSGRWRSAPLPAERAVVELDGHAIAIFHDGDRVWAVAAACPHAGNPLVEGDVLGTTLVCAFHGWRFDLETGACLFGEEAVRRYPAEVRDGEVWIDLAQLR
jgi:nitrite reductase/ring-hydroxylating ferredoxin subunit